MTQQELFKVLRLMFPSLPQEMELAALEEALVAVLAEIPLVQTLLKLREICLLLPLCQKPTSIFTKAS